MGNSEAHSHDIESLHNINNAFYIGIGLNLIFTVIEFIIGYANNSLALIADAGHNLSDVASLIISLAGMKLAQKAATTIYTYGYKKASVMASLINAVLLIFIVVEIAKKAVERFGDAPEVAGNVIIFTALVGVVINTVSAFLFYKGQKQDINIKGAFLHLLVDALVSVSVVISGVVIYYTHWNVIDSVISLIISVIIFASTWGLLKESIKLTLDGVPQNVDIDSITTFLHTHPKIESFHHLHIWALSTAENAMTVHIKLKQSLSPADTSLLKKEMREELLHQNIRHTTLELENNDEECEENGC